MRKKLISLWGNQLFRGTSIFFIAGTFTNGLSLLYHLILAPILGPIQYGNLASLLGVFYLFSIPLGAIDLLVTKIVSSFESKSLLSHSKPLIIFFVTKFAKISLIAIPLSVLLLKPAQKFLNLPDYWGIIIVIVLTVLSFVLALLRAVQKGMLNFEAIALSQIGETALKLIVSIILVSFIITNYFGALLGIVLGSLFGLILTAFQLRKVFTSPKSGFSHHHWPIKSLGIQTLLISGSFSLMYSLDIVLVKHFFDPTQAGIYAALATAGKIVYFAASPIANTLVPVVSRKAKHPQDARKDLFLIISILLAIGLSILTFYFFFPEIIIRVIFTNKFIQASSLLPWMGLALFFYSISNAAANFLLALNRIKSAFLPVLALIVEGLVIWIWHGSLSQIVGSLIVIFGILAATLVAYSLYAIRKQN